MVVLSARPLLGCEGKCCSPSISSGAPTLQGLARALWHRAVRTFSQAAPCGKSLRAWKTQPSKGLHEAGSGEGKADLPASPAGSFFTVLQVSVG